MDCSLLGSSVHRIFQTRILEWVAFPSPGDLPDSRIEHMSLISLALGDQFFLPVGTCGKPLTFVECHYFVLIEINSLNHVLLYIIVIAPDILLFLTVLNIVLVYIMNPVYICRLICQMALTHFSSLASGFSEFCSILTLNENHY